MGKKKSSIKYGWGIKDKCNFFTLNGRAAES